MPPPRVLVVEDDAAIRRGVVDALQIAGYETLEAGRGDTGRQLAVDAEFDLLLLDLVLPGGDGLDILAALRTLRPTLPVIILTARGDESDRLAGFRRGADDYVVKPFSVQELLARVAAVLRRSPERPQAVSHFNLGNAAVDLARREVHFADGAVVELSERECELLRYLAENPSRVLSRDEILARVWRLDPRGLATRTIDMHIARLREKLRDDAAEPRVIVTVRGLGYKLAVRTPADAPAGEEP
ncbi:MAG: response regulator transcription factor [Phycisphaerales bacterium]|nr:response regulator transcription factor [Phycisphaerales bacterium]